MDILRRYCLGPDPVAVEIFAPAPPTPPPDRSGRARAASGGSGGAHGHSSANINNAFRTLSGLANYLDENYSVDLPVMSIHGNHDDPSRDAGGAEPLAALDLLAVANLLNYFGRQDAIDKVRRTKEQKRKESGRPRRFRVNVRIFISSFPAQGTRSCNRLPSFLLLTLSGIGGDCPCTHPQGKNSSCAVRNRQHA
jgi:DNA repair exonuclease SbcCD nuclease subunit